LKRKEDVHCWRRSRRETPQRTLYSHALAMPIHYPDEVLVPYREFSIDAKTYYFTPGGFLYREDPGAEEMGGFFCGYLTDEVWHYRTDDG
jgi:hypothetical protein